MVQKMIDEILAKREKTAKPKIKVKVTTKATWPPPKKDADMDHTEHSMSSVGLSEMKNEDIVQGSVSSILKNFEAKKDPNAPVTPRSWSSRKKLPAKTIQDVPKVEEPQQEEKEPEETAPVEKEPEEKEDVSEKQEEEEEKEQEETKEEEEAPVEKAEDEKDAKEEEEKEPEEKQEEASTIDDSQSSAEEQKDPAATVGGKENSYVKNLKLRSNATKNVSSSEKVLEEQEVSVYDNTK